MDDTTHPDNAPAKKKRFWNASRFLMVVALLVIAAEAGYARYSYLQHSSTQQVYDNLSVFGVRLQNIENTITLHEKRIADLEEKLSKPSAPPLAASSTPTSDKSDERIAALEKEIATLKTSPNVAQPQNNIQVLQAIHLLSAFHHFSDKVLAGRPFAAELSAFYEETGKDESIEKIITPLLPYADTGIPTFATLLASFDQSMSQLNILEATPPAGLSLWERFVYNVEHLVRIRKFDETQSGNSVDDIVGRAEVHLDSEEIEAAVAEINQLPENARTSFSSWLEDAQIATATPGIIDNLEEKVMQKSFAGEPSTANPAKP